VTPLHIPAAAAAAPAATGATGAAAAACWIWVFNEEELRGQN